MKGLSPLLLWTGGKHTFHDDEVRNTAVRDFKQPWQTDKNNTRKSVKQGVNEFGDLFVSSVVWYGMVWYGSQYKDSKSK